MSSGRSPDFGSRSVISAQLRSIANVFRKSGSASSTLPIPTSETAVQ
ncbi:MAG: hypothetical protein IPP07_28935 [Holophagales bacterium]|nr:hypothetical protein [Holophagales bacterium]